MPTVLQTSVQAAAAADPLVSLIAAGTFGKVLYAGGDQYNVYAADNTTLLMRLRAQPDNSGALHLVDYSVSLDANHSSASVKGIPGMAPLVQACMAADPIQAILAAGTFGNVTQNGNGTLTVNTADNKRVLCTLHCTTDSVGGVHNLRIVRPK